MKKFHGAALDDIQLLSTVIVAKQKMSDRYHLVTIGFKACAWLKLKPGDHICIFPENNPDLVNEVMKYLSNLPMEEELVVWNGKYLNLNVVQFHEKKIFFFAKNKMIN